MENITIQITIPVERKEVTTSVSYPTGTGTNSLPKESLNDCIKGLCLAFGLSDEVVNQYCNTLIHQLQHHKKHIERTEV
jgi:hypothetical protein